MFRKLRHAILQCLPDCIVELNRPIPYTTAAARA
jgi:hypothetical protein